MSWHHSPGHREVVRSHPHPRGKPSGAISTFHHGNASYQRLFIKVPAEAALSRTAIPRQAQRPTSTVHPARNNLLLRICQLLAACALESPCCARSPLQRVRPDIQHLSHQYITNRYCIRSRSTERSLPGCDKAITRLHVSGWTRCCLCPLTTLRQRTRPRFAKGCARSRACLHTSAWTGARRSPPDRNIDETSPPSAQASRMSPRS